MAEPTADPAADCVFCKIVAGQLPASIVYQDTHTVAFVDLNPQAPFHVLVVPREHHTDLLDVSRHADAPAGFLAGIRGLVEQEGLSDFRTVLNTGAEAGQSVFHAHAHVLSGRPMGWPPG